MAKDKRYDAARFDKVDQQGDPTVFARFMDETRRFPAAQRMKKHIVEQLELEPGNSVLDVGCGTGDDIVVMAQLVGAEGRAAAVDKSEAMIAEARKRCESVDIPIELIVGSAYELPFPDGSFDAVRCERVFEHLDEPVRALQEIVRVTRSGGRIVTGGSDVDSHLFDLPDADIVRKIVHADCDRRPNGWSGRRLYCQMKEAGLVDLSVEGFVWCTGEYDRVASVLQIEKDGERALQAAQITEAESKAWSVLLEDARRTEHFFFSTTHFVVGGRKP